MRISDWSSDVCSSDHSLRDHKGAADGAAEPQPEAEAPVFSQYVIRSADDADTADETADDMADDMADDIADGGDQPAIIAETTSVIHQLAVGEAVMRMDFADLPVLVFRHGGPGGLHFVYRRTRNRLV